MRIVVISKQYKPDEELLKLINPSEGCLERYKQTYNPLLGYTYEEKEIKKIPNNNDGQRDDKARARWVGRPNMKVI